MQKLNYVRFRDLIELELSEDERNDYSYKNMNCNIHVNKFCDICEENFPKESKELHHILFGTTTRDYLEYLNEDILNTKDWNPRPIMFVFENPGKCPKDDFISVNFHGETKDVPSKTWPYIGWDNKKCKQDFILDDNLTMKKYGELICATILFYKLKNAYVTNLVKCGTEKGDNLRFYYEEVVNKCVETIFAKELEAIQPAIIFAFSKKVYSVLNNKFPDKKVVRLPHPAARISNAKRAELLKTKFNDVFGTKNADRPY